VPLHDQQRTHFQCFQLLDLRSRSLQRQPLLHRTLSSAGAACALMTCWQRSCWGPLANGTRLRLAAASPATWCRAPPLTGQCSHMHTLHRYSVPMLGRYVATRVMLLEPC
jgi:hypothetical protein